MALLEALCESTPKCVQLLCLGVGALVVAKKVYGALQFLLQVFVLSGIDVRKYGKPGTWAVVTGASDGLGKEFAEQLAKKGFNLVLVSRTRSKLEALAEQLRTATPGPQGRTTETRIVAMDYAQDRDEDYQTLAETVADLDVGILVNNVGQSHSIPVPFLETERQEMQDIVTINCLGTLKTTQIVAPLLSKRGKGLILTIGSFAGWLPTPYLSTYAGSKAFLQHWTESAAPEMKEHGIDMHLCLSYLVTTAMSKIRRPNFFVPTPRPFVRAALSKIGNGGFQRNANTYTPWWTHSLMLAAAESTLGTGNPYLIANNFDAHKDIRRRALKKAEREAKKQ